MAKDKLSKRKLAQIALLKELEEEGALPRELPMPIPAHVKEEMPAVEVEAKDETLHMMGNEKSYDDEPGGYSYGATSFDELDSAREASKTASIAYGTASDLQNIISNIMWNDGIDDKPTAINKAVAEFSARYQPVKKSWKETILEELDSIKKKIFGEKQEKPKPPETLMVLKDKNGNYRWLGIASNNFVDRDGEIITEDAHKEFLSHLDAHPDEAPLFVTWHVLASARKSRADFWDYHDGFVIFGGPLTESEANGLLKAKEKYTLGMSHGFYALYDAASPNQIARYRSFEVSDLPIERAANAWTSLDVLSKEVSMDPKKRDLLEIEHGAEKIEEFLSGIKAQSEALKALGVASKETAQPETPEAPVAPVDPPVEPPAETPVAEAAKETVVALSAEQIAKDLGLPQLDAFLKDMQSKHDAENKAANDQIAVLTAQVKDLQKSSDDKLAEKIAPAFTPFVWQMRASQSKDTEIQTGDVPTPPVGPADWMKNIVATPN